MAEEGHLRSQKRASLISQHTAGLLKSTPDSSRAESKHLADHRRQTIATYLLGQIRSALHQNVYFLKVIRTRPVIHRILTKIASGAARTAPLEHRNDFVETTFANILLYVSSTESNCSNLKQALPEDLGSSGKPEIGFPRGTSKLGSLGEPRNWVLKGNPKLGSLREPRNWVLKRTQTWVVQKGKRRKKREGEGKKKKKKGGGGKRRKKSWAKQSLLVPNLRGFLP
ncbi:hypothetical protein SLEP1_g49721 [Rubroshorea leprosula]|uniref:Uncharacterized protein n=1 Tax=Rubroshorea leprosula TaxID=152421 RepID=A0AAV5LXR4_9ROSI|nr:hypothetical protein SLEP1_g49721 [Rubroshorea leprosula]